MQIDEYCTWLPVNWNAHSTPNEFNTQYNVNPNSIFLWWLSISQFKEIGVRGHFCMWHWDKSSNCRGVIALYRMNICCLTRKILLFEFFRLHILSMVKFHEKWHLKSAIWSYKINITCLSAIKLHKKLECNYIFNF